MKRGKSFRISAEGASTPFPLVSSRRTRSCACPDSDADNNATSSITITLSARCYGLRIGTSMEECCAFRVAFVSCRLSEQAVDRSRIRLGVTILARSRVIDVANEFRTSRLKSPRLEYSNRPSVLSPLGVRARSASSITSDRCFSTVSEKKA